MRDVHMASVRAIDRAVDILLVFSHAQSELSLEQISAMSQIPKSTVYRILFTLERRRLILFDEETLRYRLGFQFLSFADIVSSTSNLRRMGAPFLEQLYASTGLSAFLSVVEGHHLIYIDRREASEGLKVSLFEGPERPLVYGAFGFVSLAFLDALQQDRLLAQPIPKFTKDTVTDVATIRSRLQEIRKTHFYLESDEAIPGVTGMASPIFDVSSQYVATIGVIGPNVALAEGHLETCKRSLLKAAGQLSAVLGYTEVSEGTTIKSIPEA